MDKIFIHVCCAPCSIKVFDHFEERSVKPIAYFYNPYIHPFTEFKNRLVTLREYTKKRDIPLIEHCQYEIEEYMRDVLFRTAKKCFFCYEKRLSASAHMAQKSGFSHFTTTLLASTYQNHELIKEIGNKCAEKNGIEFYYHDFRETFKNSLSDARKEQLYMQQYCGCIISELERYGSEYKKLTGGK